ncbi:hypothetical protein K523DRAFT_311733 [Schizophyllum commune Tattone D]|nr:hypothetical protein K523DRAFT_311733 [Schizophyllum commune Tattone D]
MLWRLIAGGDDFVPLVRALRLGLLPLLRDVSRTLPSCNMHRLASHVAAAAHFPSVLRVIRSQLRTIPSDGDSTGKASLGRWIQSYGELLVEIKRAEEVTRTAPQFWKVRYKCHGTMGPHNREVRACPCAEVYYCSGSCQRMMRKSHASSCASDNIWDTEGILSPKDAVHIQGASSVFVQDYEDSIWSALDDLGRRKGPVGYATLTLNFAYDGEPAHELKVRNIINHAPPANGWDVNIRAKVYLGGCLLFWNLPWSFTVSPVIS